MREPGLSLTPPKPQSEAKTAADEAEANRNNVYNNIARIVCDAGGRMWLLARVRHNDFPLTYHPDEGGKVRLHFKSAEGMEAKGGELKGFQIAGGDRQWHWADARIDGDSVVVSSDKVPLPVAVRYDWAHNPQGNLYNKAGLPAVPFRTDDWPGVTVGKN